MYIVEKILKEHKIKTQVINTPGGLVVMADNEDGTFEMFYINTITDKIYEYLGY